MLLRKAVSTRDKLMYNPFSNCSVNQWRSSREFWKELCCRQSEVDQHRTGLPVPYNEKPIPVPDFYLWKCPQPLFFQSSFHTLRLFSISSKWIYNHKSTAVSHQLLRCLSCRIRLASVEWPADRFRPLLLSEVLQMEKRQQQLQIIQRTHFL